MYIDRIVIIFLFLCVIALSGMLIHLDSVISDLEDAPALPYSRPHIEYVSKTGLDCAGWYINGGRGAVLLCEGKPPKIVVIKTKNSQSDYGA